MAELQRVLWRLLCDFVLHYKAGFLVTAALFAHFEYTHDSLGYADLFGILIEVNYDQPDTQQWP